MEIPKRILQCFKWAIFVWISDWGEERKKRYWPLKESSSAQPTIPQHSPQQQSQVCQQSTNLRRRCFSSFMGRCESLFDTKSIAVSLKQNSGRDLFASYARELITCLPNVNFSDNLSAAGVILRYKLTPKGGYLLYITNHYLAITVLLTPRVCHSHIPLHLHEFRFHNNYWKTKK